MYKSVFKATAFSSINPHEVLVLKDYLFCINDDGYIEHTFSPDSHNYQEIFNNYKDKPNFYSLNEGQYILPGFIDLHIHAPQYAQTGTALDLPLNVWLNTYTFPLESKFSDIHFAREVYQDLVDTLIAHGTTTALYFATIHKDSSYLLAEICSQKGQRGLIGKIVMDDKEQNPEYYRDESCEQALSDTESFIQKVQQLNKITKQGVYPVITPRFIPSCTDQVLTGLGKLAKKYDVHIQSHCSESDWAHQFVKNRMNKNDAVALNHFGLLREKSVMAHCNFLTDEDADLFAKTGTAIAHCPISNAYFANSVIPISKFKNKGVEIGLGTDISGGFSPSLYSSIRQAVMSSRMLEDGVDTGLSGDKRGVGCSRITAKEAFYFATAGGGKSLSLPIGKLEPGMCWDIQIIDTKVETAKIPIYEVMNESLDDIFQKILYLSHSENIREVWVQGNQVYSRNK